MIPMASHLLIALLLSVTPADDEICIHLLSGEKVTTASITVDPEGTVVAGETDSTLPEIRSIVLSGETPPPVRGGRLVLSSGGTLAGTVPSGDADAIRFRSDLISEVSIPLAGVRAFRIGSPEVDDTPFREQMARDDEADSVFVLREGALLRIPGGFRSLDDTGLSLVWEGQERTLPLEKVFGVIFPASGAPPPTMARITLADGGRIHGEILSLDASTLKVRIPAGAEISIARSGVLRIDVRSDRLLFLSDLDPARVEEIPFFDTVWPHRRDRSLDGGPIRLKGQTYEKGLGVHSRCLLTYDLPPRAETFFSVIGIDDETEGLGDVVFRVHGDEEVLFDSGRITAKDEPRTVRLDIRGRQRIVLEVDFGEDLDIGDHADWADAHVILGS
jgi:hypothetical protein